MSKENLNRIVTQLKKDRMEWLGVLLGCFDAFLSVKVWLEFTKLIFGVKVGSLNPEQTLYAALSLLGIALTFGFLTVVGVNLTEKLFKFIRDNTLVGPILLDEKQNIHFGMYLQNNKTNTHKYLIKPFPPSPR